MNRFSIKYLIVHHTAGNIQSTRADILCQALEKGYGDIPYHKLIFHGGVIKQGRKDDVPGAATYGFNFNSLAICMVGNFDRFLIQENNKQFIALENCLYDLAVRHRIATHNIITHHSAGLLLKDKYFTQCPGQYLNALFNLLIDKLDSRLADFCFPG